MNIDETAKEMRKLIERIKKGFQDDSYSNEESIKQKVVVPILGGLKWPIFDDDFQYEYSLNGMRADIALLHKGQPKVIIEVKRPGAADSTEAKEQLFQYTYHAGVPLAVLTTGQEWEFYLPMRPGAYQDRQVYKLDISARETEESVSRLMRYLSYPDICSGKAVERAEADHGDKTRAKKIHDALPKAWNEVLSECDARLLELLKDKVGDICGFTPDVDVVSTFIRKKAGSAVPYQPQPSIPSNFVRNSTPKPSKSKKLKLKGFELHGRKHDAHNAVGTLVAVFEALIERDTSFPDRFMKTHPGKSRRWLANQQSHLYTNRPDLCNDCSRQLFSGHWVGTNNSTSAKEDIIKAACKVAGIQYGKDLKLLYL